MWERVFLAVLVLLVLLLFLLLWLAIFSSVGPKRAIWGGIAADIPAIGGMGYGAFRYRKKERPPMSVR